MPAPLLLLPLLVLASSVAGLDSFPVSFSLACPDAIELELDVAPASVCGSASIALNHQPLRSSDSATHGLVAVPRGNDQLLSLSWSSSCLPPSQQLPHHIEILHATVVNPHAVSQVDSPCRFDVWYSVTSPPQLLRIDSIPANRVSSQSACGKPVTGHLQDQTACQAASASPATTSKEQIKAALVTNIKNCETVTCVAKSAAAAARCFSRVVLLHIVPAKGHEEMRAALRNGQGSVNATEKVYVPLEDGKNQDGVDRMSTIAVTVACATSMATLVLSCLGCCFCCARRRRRRSNRYRRVKGERYKDDVPKPEPAPKCRWWRRRGRGRCSDRGEEKERLVESPQGPAPNNSHVQGRDAMRDELRRLQEAHEVIDSLVRQTNVDNKRRRGRSCCRHCNRDHSSSEAGDFSDAESAAGSACCDGCSVQHTLWSALSRSSSLPQYRSDASEPPEYNSLTYPDSDDGISLENGERPRTESPSSPRVASPRSSVAGSASASTGPSTIYSPPCSVQGTSPRDSIDKAV